MFKEIYQRTEYDQILKCMPNEIKSTKQRKSKVELQKLLMGLAARNITLFGRILFDLFGRIFAYDCAKYSR